MSNYKLIYPVYKLNRKEIDYLLKEVGVVIETMDEDLYNKLNYKELTYSKVLMTSLKILFPDIKMFLPYRETNPIDLLQLITYKEDSPIFYEELGEINREDYIWNSWEPWAWDSDFSWEHYDEFTYYKKFIKGKHKIKRCQTYQCV